MTLAMSMLKTILLVAWNARRRIVLPGKMEDAIIRGEVDVDS
jgi:hypothetical protein